MVGWHPFFLLGVLPILTAKCQKSSLSFVIDDTGSMGDDIEQVRHDADAIMNIVLEEKSSQIENIVLVTFNDPSVKLREITTDRNQFRRALYAIRPAYGDDCPEMAMGGIHAALNASLPDSFLYVFTDASAKDYWKGKQVQELCQRKQSQVIFVLTGDCNDPASDLYRVFYDVATSCAGMVFRVGKDEVTAVLKTVRETIKGNKTVLTSKMAPPYQYTDIPFVIDDQTEYVTVSASGNYVELVVTGPYKHFENLLTTQNGKVVKILDPLPGKYNARVWGTTSISVVVVGRTDFFFSHGFSLAPPKSLKETTLVPDAYAETYITVLVNNPDNSVQVLSAEILDQNENKITDQLPLREIGDKLYTTTIPFEVPPHMFKIAVNGKIILTQKDIRRISKIPVNPTLHALEAPRIISKVPTFYEGITGDVGLWIPCKVVGYPKPTVIWKMGDAVIASNEKYVIEDDTLIIKDLKRSDSNKYSCEVRNRAGSDFNKVEVKITDHLDNYGIRHIVHIRKGDAINLVCTLPHTRTSSTAFRWFVNGNEVAVHTPHYTVKNADYRHDGNYTCHTSSAAGSWTETFEVDVGVPPQFTDPQDRELIQWNGETKEVLNCNAEAKPHPKIEWNFDGKRLDNSNFLKVVSKWGHYSCKVSNTFGTLERRFEVKISGCMIPRNEQVSAKMPLILSKDSSWPKFYTSGEYIKINADEKLILSCPDKTANAFQRFPALSTIEATCRNGDTFIVNNRLYEYTDLQCNNEFYPQVVKTNITCSTDSTLIKVGYNVNSFVETYSVCFDNDNQMPLYTLMNVSATKYNVSSAVQKWYGYPGIGDNEGAYTCETSSSSCCYAKSQLVSAQDFSYGASQNTTFIHPLNAVPLWKPCDNRTTWEEINDMMRQQAEIHPPFVVASGTHASQKINGTTIPRYLWKMVKVGDEEPMAIVYVNGPHPTFDDILCPDVCSSEFDSWLHHNDDSTYCCTIDDFFDAFQLPGEIRGGAREAEHRLS